MKVALLGDSHAKVTFRSLIPLLEKAGDSVVYERAENGWSLQRHIANGSIRRLRESKPDFIILSLGGNNRDTKADSYKSTVDTLLNMAKDIGAKVIWVGPTTSDTTIAPNTEKRHAWTHNFLSKYIPKRGGQYISIRELTKSGQTSDGVHYPYKFYSTEANHVNSKLKRPGKVPLLAVVSGVGLLMGLLL